MSQLRTIVRKGEVGSLGVEEEWLPSFWEGVDQF